MTRFKTLFLTELKLNLRVLDVPIFGVVFPLLVAFILGSVYGSENTVMMNQTFAAVSTIGIAANGLMGLPLTLTTYRANKILKQLEVTPLPTYAILIVQFLVKTLLSILSSMLVWLMLTIVFKYQFEGSLIIFVSVYMLVVCSIFGIGIIIASVSPNVNTANLLSSIVYFPMLFLSGATIPQSVLPKSVATILQLLPLTQGIKMLDAVAVGNLSGIPLISVVVLILIACVSVIISLKFFKWE